MTWQEIHQFDQQLSLTINSWNSSFSDPIWAFLSEKLVWVPMYAAIIALLIWKLGWKKAGLLIIGTVLTIVCCDQFANLIKNAVCRIRPLHDEWMIANGVNVLEQGGGYSFFSAHAANSFGLAACTYYGLKKCLEGSQNLTDHKIVRFYGWFMYIWAALVGISRIFVGKHYLGDVIVGTLVGIGFGLALGWLSCYAVKRLLKR